MKSILIASLIALGLAACGDSSPSQQSATAESPAPADTQRAPAKKDPRTFSSAQKLIFLETGNESLAADDPAILKMDSYLKSAAAFKTSEDALADQIERAMQVAEKQGIKTRRLELAEAVASLSDLGGLGVSDQDILASYLQARGGGMSHKSAIKGIHQFITAGMQK